MIENTHKRSVRDKFSVESSGLRILNIHVLLSFPSRHSLLSLLLLLLLTSPPPLPPPLILVFFHQISFPHTDILITDIKKIIFLIKGPLGKKFGMPTTTIAQQNKVIR